MNLDNLTPFSALLYDVIDERDQECHVLVTRGTYSLSPASSSVGDKSDTMSPATVIAEVAVEQADVLVADEYFGEVNRSSVKQESDLAPGKPKCDVIIVGSAHSPTGRPIPRVEIGVRIQRLTAIPPFADKGVRLEHRLTVHGSRAFVRHRKTLSADWRLTEPDLFVSQPLRYEHALGGELKVYEQDSAAPRLGDRERLSDSARARHPDGERAPVAHTLCPHNPLGIGWLEEWYAGAASVERWEAPQIEAPSALLTAEIFGRMLRREVRAGDLPELTPRGVGVIAKPWLPRLALAGTLDGRWLAERWPSMPHDYHIGYWNGAHADMQCQHLFGGELVELWNLLPRTAPGISTTEKGRTKCCFQLPDPVLAAKMKQGNNVVWGVPVIDTLIINLEEMRLGMVWRMRVPVAAGIKSASLVTLGERQVKI
jgi:hypothetical protein